MMKTRVLFLVFLYPLMISVETSTRCPADDVYTILYNGKCFKLFNETLSWTDAKNFCWNNFYNGTLAEPVTDDELYAVYNLINSTNILRAKSICIISKARNRDASFISSFNKSKCMKAWIGASDIKLEGYFTWESDDSPMVTTRWPKNQPDDQRQNEDCVEMYPSRLFINDFRCFELINFVCQTDPCDVIYPGSLYAYGQCLKYFDLSLTWDDAMKFCLSQESYLAEPTTPTLQNIITIYLYNSTAWLGASDQNSNGQFRWTVNKAIVTSNFSRLQDTTGQNKYVMWTKSDWLAKSNRELEGFVCQKDSTVLTPNPRRYVSVLPKLIESRPVRGLLQVTSSVNIVLYLEFSVYYDYNIVNTTIVPLAPGVDANFYMDENIFIFSTAIIHHYVEIISSQPVTIIQYIMDSSTALVGSSLLFPVDFYTQNTTEMMTSYLLITNNVEELETYLTVTSLSAESNDLTLMFNTDNVIMYSTCGTGEIVVSKTENISTNLDRIYTTMNIKLKANLDGSYLFGSKSLMVSLGTPDAKMDPTFDNILPLHRLGTEYFPLSPYVNNGDTVNTSVKCLAVFDYTQITIFPVNKTVVLAAGESQVITLQGSTFYHIYGNTSFYAYQTFYGISGIRHDVCVTSLLPPSTWRYDYQFARLSDSYTVILYVIIDVATAIVASDTVIQWKCSNISGTQYAGCYTKLPSYLTYLHLRLSDALKTFGAYQLAMGQNLYFCNPMGINDTISTSTNYFHHYEYLLKSKEHKLCNLETTTYTTYEKSSEHTSELTTHLNTQVYLTQEVSRVTLTSNAIGITSATDKVTATITVTPKVVTDGFMLNFYNGSLKLNYRELSFYVRTKTSAEDDRFSATICGITGVCILILYLSLFVASDLMNVYLSK